MLYLIHLEKKLGDRVQHYLGYVEKPGNLGKRLKEHRKGIGSKLLKACNEQGIGYKVVAIFKGDRSEERRLKKLKTNFSCYCPECQKIARQKALQLELFTD
jgi:hypothetical protein